MKYVIAFLTILSIGAFIFAGPFRRGGSCGPGGCGNSQIMEDIVEWKAVDDDELQLLINGRRVGNYRYSDNIYRPINEFGGWGDSCQPMTPPPTRIQKTGTKPSIKKVNPDTGNLPTGVLRPKVPNPPKEEPKEKEEDTHTISIPTQSQLEKEGKIFGVDWKKSLTGQKRMMVVSQPCPEVAECKAFTEDGQLVDQSKKWHLTVCYKDKSKTIPLKNDLVNSPELASINKDFRFQEYGMSEKVPQKIMESFQLEKDKKFQETGLVIMAQAPEGTDGKSKPYVRYDYPGPSIIAKELGNLRKVDPNYDPNNLPSMTGGSSDFMGFPLWMWIAGVLLFFYLTKENKNVSSTNA